MIDDCCSGRPEEHAPPRSTFEISLSLHGAIVLPGGVIQFNPNPVSSCEVGVTDVAYCSYSPVLKFDSLANLEVGNVAHCVAQPRESWILAEYFSLASNCLGVRYPERNVEVGISSKLVRALRTRTRALFAVFAQIDRGPNGKLGERSTRNRSEHPWSPYAATSLPNRLFMASPTIKLVISPRGKPIKTLPDECEVPRNAPAAEIYQQLAAASRMSVNRLRVTKGSDGQLVPNSKDVMISRTGLLGGSKIYVKDLGKRTLPLLEFRI